MAKNNLPETLAHLRRDRELNTDSFLRGCHPGGLFFLLTGGGFQSTMDLDCPGSLPDKLEFGEAK